MRGCGGCPKGEDGGVFWSHGGTLGTCPGDTALWDVLHPFALSFPACWGLWFVFFYFLFFPLCTFFVLLNLTCILNFCGVVYLMGHFLCNLVIFCIMCQNNNVS